MECLFCDWVSGKKQVLWEGDNIIVFVASLAYTKGHLLVCPKKHYESIKEVPDDVKKELFFTGIEMGERLKEKLGSVSYSIGLNEKLYLAEPHKKTHIPHVHMHVIPRMEGEEISYKERLHLGKEDIVELVRKLMN